MIASDPDTRANQTLSYNISGGDSSGMAMFVVNNPSSGQVEVKQHPGPDFEVRNEYILTYSVTDSGNPPLSISRQLKILVRDINEPPTVATKH